MAAAVPLLLALHAHVAQKGALALAAAARAPATAAVLHRGVMHSGGGGGGHRR